MMECSTASWMCVLIERESVASSEATRFRFGEKYFTMGRDVDSPVAIAVVQAVARSELPGFEVFGFLPAIYAGQSATRPQRSEVTAACEQEPPQSLSSWNQMGR